ncbi:hypothetical protein V5799_030232 [Amblyomma americanum]|uniref:YqaJ viral recombinase domain-containing protein n=1 Tax=Amblyomma americanum TaxID=6943 RepID=A0AAQ4ENR4_AMBAM
MSRKKWTEKCLANLTAMKNLSRVRAIRYGIANERYAILRHKDTMIAAGHPVEIIDRRIFVNSTEPWLGASPDAIAFDTCQPFPWGAVEVECPYSLKDATKEDIVSQHFFVEFDENCQPTLKNDRERYMHFSAGWV